MQTELTLVNGRWRLGSRVGAGAEAEVWAAQDERTGVAVALKALRVGADRDRLRAEFALLSSLDHPNLVQVFDLEQACAPGPFEEGRLFYTAALHPGAPAKARFAELKDPRERARALCQLLGEVAQGLDAMHRLGLVHRDVKPANLLLDREGRTRLGDLGLAARAGEGSGALSGTLAYLAPEAALAPDEPRGDLYALGATAVELWTGERPFAIDSLEDFVRVERTAPRIDEASPPAPTALASLVAQLLDPDPAGRPVSARAVALEAARLGARLDGEFLAPEAAPWVSAPVLVGRTDDLERLVEALATAPVVLVLGEEGSGRSRLCREALRRLQLEAARRGVAAAPRYGPSAAAAAAQLAPGASRSGGGDEAISAKLRVGALCEGLARSRAILHLVEGNDAFERELLSTAAHGAAVPSTVLAEGPPGLADRIGAGPGVVVIALRSLSVDETSLLVASMLEQREAGLGSAVHRASGGNPRRAVELVRAAAATGRVDERGLGQLADQGIEALVRRAITSLPAPTRLLIGALAAAGRPARLAELGSWTEQDLRSAFAELGPAVTAGVVELDGDRARFPSRAHAAASEGGLTRAQTRALHRRMLAEVPLGAEGLAARAHHLLAVGPRAAAAEAALAAGEVALGAFELSQAAQLLAAARDRGRGALRLRASLLLARVHLAAADYPAAQQVLRPLCRALDPRSRSEACLALARALQRQGELRGAEAQLRRVLRDGPEAAVAAEARGLLGRVLVERGAYARAEEVCQDGRSSEEAEARGLASLYQGKLTPAEEAFAQVEVACAERGPAARARAAALTGMVAQTRGDLHRAAEAYARARELATQACDLHGAAIYVANLAATLRELGDYGRALPVSEEAARLLGRIGKRGERAQALCNHGNLLVSLGDLEGAERVGELGLAEAEAVQASLAAGYARLLLGDVARRRGQGRAAIELYRQASRSLAGAGARERLPAWLNLAEALGEQGHQAEAVQVLGDAEALAQVVGERDTTALARVRLHLLLDRSRPPPQAELLVQVLEQATAQGRRDRAFRAAFLLAWARLRAGQSGPALALIETTRRLWEEIVMRTPPPRRPQLATDPDARRLAALVAAAEAPQDEAPAAPTAPSPIGGAASRMASAPPKAPEREAALRRLLTINKRLNSELRLDRLLELILDTVIDLTAAERGLLLLTDPEGRLRVEVARNMDQRAAEEGEASFSRSIAERAAREGAPIVTVDASGDARFQAALSVSDLRLRSVLAVPLCVKGKVVGCVYADHRLRAGAFGEADVSLVSDLADQAAIAVENARLVQENERRGQQSAALARELEEKVAAQALELGQLHKEVRSSRAALQVRYNYDKLVGRTPRMIELFRLLDRVTDTALPVVIYGESGTGKELVARAIHHNGPRRAQAFVSESCAAIPETLLEAALFGHVRGAFTGADGDRRGLFEIASGGTLFLDEVGEMSPGMQAKLLRVLQEGELRRVGAERTLRVDVRLLVASNRDLGRLVADGRFREDLFYRLNVVRVALPPLRERREDIPLLVERFLRRHAEATGQAPRRIARAALQRLVAYHWPGNVRELENEVTRAASLGGELLGLDDLSPHVQAGELEAAVDGPDDLSLKQRVERLERSLLREALHRTEGNQSRAAHLLGLSRFGLQKKLRRYGMEA